MTNLFYNLPINIQASIYSFDSTFHDKYNTSINEMMKLMDEPIYCFGEDYCYYCCYCCDGDYYYSPRRQREGDRMKEYFKPIKELKRIKQEIINEQKLIDDDGFVKVTNKKTKAKKVRTLKYALARIPSRRNIL